MTLKQHACLTIACDICGETFTDEEQGATPHFDSAAEARAYQDAWDAEYRWTIRDDGYAICPLDDEEFSHDLARAALTAVPDPQVPGQTVIALAGTEGGR